MRFTRTSVEEVAWLKKKHNPLINTKLNVSQLGWRHTRRRIKTFFLRVEPKNNPATLQNRVGFLRIALVPSAQSIPKDIQLRPHAKRITTNP